MAYLTINPKTIDKNDDRNCMMGIESVTAGAYGPSAEELFCPTRQPTTKESKNNQPDQTDEDDKADREMRNDHTKQATK